MAALFEGLSNSGVNREDNMFYNLIITELYNDDNEMEDPKCYNVEEYQASVRLKKKKKNMTHCSIPCSFDTS